MAVKRNSVTFGDLVGKVEMLHIACTKCDRAGQYRVLRLIREQGEGVTLLDWKDLLTRNCPRRVRVGGNDPCGAHFPDLNGVF